MFDPSQNQLDITEQDTFIPGFFGPFIKNVTGIVGENAAGKTNLLELINYLLDGGNTKVNTPFFLIFEDFQQFTVFEHRLGGLTANRAIELVSYDSTNIPISAIYFTNTFDGRRHEFGKKIHDLSTNKLLQNTFGENIHNNIKKEVQAQISFLQSETLRKIENEQIELGHPNLRPDFAQFTSPAWSTINNKAKHFDERVSTITGQRYQSLTEFCKSFRKKITDNFSSRSFSYFTAFLVFMDFSCNEFMPESAPIGRRYSPNVAVNSSMIDYLERLQIDRLIDARINDVFEIITIDVAKFIDEIYSHTFEKAKFLMELQHRDLPAIEKITEGTYTSRKFQFRSPFAPEIEKFIWAYTEATTHQSLNYTIEWLGLSSGQRAFLNLFSRLHTVSGKIKSASVIITIDEGDLYFHPKWQVEYLARLILAFPIIFNDKNIQLVLTTHSPFLVSDLTKKHLIFLRKNNEQRCETIPHEELEETFGGNIGELYLNAFFLNGSLISNFAAHRIRHILNRIKSDKSNFDGYDLRIINQLGDRLIRYQLQKLLNDTN